MIINTKNIISIVTLFMFTVEVFSSEIGFRSIDMNSGLSHNSALCLLQDHHGYVWIGTRDGLNKYDGKDFTVYKRIFNDSASLINNQINCLYESSDKKIWVGTANGLNIYDSETDRFSRINLINSNNQVNSGYILNLAETSDKSIWVGTTQGIFVIHDQGQSIRHYFIDTILAQNSNTVFKIMEDKNQNIWIGTRKGLFLVKHNRFFRYYIDEEKEKNTIQFTIRDIDFDDEGSFLISTENDGIYVTNFHNDSFVVKSRITSENNLLPSNTVRRLIIQNPENIWIGTLEGLVLYNSVTHTSRIFSKSEYELKSISSNSIRDILHDSEGGIWISTYAGGVNYYHPQMFIFKHHFSSSELNHRYGTNVVSVFLEDSDEKIWIGTEGGGLLYYDFQNDSIIHHYNTDNSSISSNNIKSLVFGNTGLLWIGTFDGLNLLHMTSGKIDNYFADPINENSLNHNQLHALHFENDNKVWIGTNGGGVQVFNPVQNTFRTIPGTEMENVNTFYFDHSETIWVGSQNEIFTINCRLNAYKPASEILPEHRFTLSNITFINEDTQKRKWIGTNGNGLFCLHNNDLFWFNTNNGLPDNTVNALLEGNDKTLWITTNKGLSKIEIRKDEANKYIIGTVTYSVEEGLQGLQFYPNSAFKSKSGKLFFGGINGFNVFEPGETDITSRFPDLVLKELHLKYKPVNHYESGSPLKRSINETEHLVLNYNQRDFSVSFAGINFINPEKTVYRYMVSGLDDEWIYLENQPFVNFTYFPVGNYEIRFQASTQSEKWGDNYRSIHLTVLPPWWQTWWAFLIYIFLLVSLLLIFFNISQKWARIKNQLIMEHFQREKENELHQLKLKFFTDVSHELRTPLTLILAPLENLIQQWELPNRLRNQLIQIQRSGFRMMQLINQVLDLRKLETGHERLEVANGNIIRFLKEISLAFNEIAISKNLNFDFHPHKNELPFWYDRDKLEIIINNLLSNAFKFSFRNGKVILATKEVKGTELPENMDGINNKYDYLEIDVTNDGEGIDSVDLEQIYNRFYSKKSSGGIAFPNVGVGLELTKRMVELHKGRISVSSVKHEIKGGSQTTFSVWLPIGKELYSSEEINLNFKNSEDSSLYTNEFLKSETIISAGDEIFEPEDSYIPVELEKILIIEDNPEVRKFTKELLVKKYNVYEAENGETGFSTAIEVSPDLIISDIMMPVMDGIELCRKIKTDARTSHIPVILLTARTAVTFKYEGLETGADDYITKPFSAQYLLLRIMNLIKQRNILREHFKREAICDPGTITVTSTDERLLKKAVDYITENISNPSINVNNLSEYLGLSRVHFYRKIKALTNQTAVEFIRSVKLKRAASVLSQGKLSVKEVQNMVGFEDADYFRKCFKEQFGVNPSEYSNNRL
jgi:ligand-binding sensor domain-containing protein/signal transduction histidine kinase/DNA-binding response OmpR family regulator